MLDEIEMICAMLNYSFICNNFGWNENIVLEIERKSRYHGYICMYMLQY